MRDTIISVFSLSLIALLVLDGMMVSPAFSGGTPRTFTGLGAGEATFYVNPQDYLYTSTTPITSAIGTYFTVNVRTANATHIASWQVELSYNKNYLSTVTANCSYAADMIFPPGSYSPIAPSIGAENATHNYILMTATTNGAVEYSATDAGLITVQFTIIADPPALTTYWSSLYLERPGIFGCFALDTNLDDNTLTLIDGYYENAYAGRLIDVFVGTGTGPYPAPYGGQGQDKVAGVFEPQDPVCAYALVTYNGDPVQSKLVTFIVMSPSGLYDFSRTAITNATGYAYTEFGIPWPTVDPYAEIYGIWNITVKVDIRSVVVEDTVWFTVSWRDPTASKTHLPDVPLIYEVVTFNASTSVAYRNVLGVITPDPTYIAAYTWDFGDGSPIVTVDTPIIAHAYASMGIYTVSLTVTDLKGRNGTVSQEVEVVLGRLIDVFVGTGTGPYPAPYGGQGADKVADVFEPQKTVCVYANVTYNGDPVQSKLVTFIILSPHNLHDFSRTAVTNSTGYAYTEFGLPWPCVDPVNEIFGIWNITVKVDIRSTVVEDTVAFKVWWLIETTSVVPVPAAAEFVKGDYARFDITFRTYRMQPIDTVIEITLYDDLGVPFAAARVELQGIGWGNYTWCQFKEYKIEFETEIPKWAFVGTGTVYANAFHVAYGNPYNMGSPYCPEAHAIFRILKEP